MEKDETVARKVVPKTKDAWPKSGSYKVRLNSGGFAEVNRRTARKKQVSRAYTSSNYKYHNENRGFKHVVSTPNLKVELPLHDPKVSNHIRHRQNQVYREQARKMSTGAGG